MYKTTTLVIKFTGLTGNVDDIAKQIEDYLNTDPVPGYLLLNTVISAAIFFVWVKKE